MSMRVLQPGDGVDIVATSSKCSPDVLQNMKQFIESWGLTCVAPGNLFGESTLYAHSDEMRFFHLKEALFSTRSKAIWCLLGGYGATKLIPMLASLPPPPAQKLFIGFSDVTALHIFLQNAWGWSTIHGPSGLQACLNRISQDSIALLQKLLFTPNFALSYDLLSPLNCHAETLFQCQAPIIGGNLHLIQASLATPWQINTKGKILFIEEVGERAYRIDRALAQMSQAGIFDEVKALIFGDMMDPGEPDGKKLVDKVVSEFAATCSFPVVQLPGVGHGSVNNPLILGAPAELKREKNRVKLIIPTQNEELVY